MGAPYLEALGVVPYLEALGVAQCPTASSHVPSLAGPACTKSSALQLRLPPEKMTHKKVQAATSRATWITITNYFENNEPRNQELCF